MIRGERARRVSRESIVNNIYQRRFTNFLASVEESDGIIRVNLNSITSLSLKLSLRSLRDIFLRII